MEVINPATGDRVATYQELSEEGREVFEEFATHVAGEASLSEGHREALEEAFERLREAERGA